MKFIRKVVKYGCDLFIDRVFAPIFILLPTTKTILLESVPSLSDSTYEVYKELLKRGVNKKYKIVWWLYDNCEISPDDNVVYIRKNDWKIKIKYYEYTAKCIVSCNRFLEAHSRKQVAFYISHGSPLKSVSGYYFMPKGIQYFFCASEGFRIPFAQQIHADPQKGFCLGLPRNDVMGTLPQRKMGDYFNCPDCKSIIWYPTFRQHKTGVRTGAKYSFPIIHDENALKELNEHLKRRNVIIVIKPHFAQDLSGLKKQKWSNFFFIDDDFFKVNGVSSYEFVNSSDALISDYSSIYYDYLLCDKPIGLAWEDIEDYKRNPGFSMDVEQICKGGVKIYSIQELLQFVDDVSLGIDRLKNERERINSFANFSNDHCSATRVTDKILQLSGLDKV